MSINSKKLWKYLNDVGLINKIENNLKYYIYFVDYIGEYMPYINGAGMDFDTMYTYEVEKVIKYNDAEIYYSHETQTFRGEDNYTPDKYSRGSIICSNKTDLKDAKLSEEYTKEKLEEAIIADYGITEETIDNFYNNKTIQENENDLTNEESISHINEKENHLVELFEKINNINIQIKDKKELIEQLKEAVSQLEIEKEGIIEEIQITSNSKIK